MRILKEVLNEPMTKVFGLHRQNQIDAVKFSSMKVFVDRGNCDAVALVAQTNKGYDVNITIKGGTEDVLERPMTCSCTCPDFHHRFLESNGKHGCLFGKTSIIKLMHADGEAGMCKHLIKAVDEL